MASEIIGEILYCAGITCMVASVILAPFEVKLLWFFFVGFAMVWGALRLLE